jgi:hypothetical protein
MVVVVENNLCFGLTYCEAKDVNKERRNGTEGD